MVALALPLCAQRPDAAQIRKVTREIADITGFEIRRDVPYSSISREDWKRWVAEQIRETVKPAEIRAEELALRIFGLIPADFDLKRATIDLLGEQAAAVYDHRHKRMLFVQGAGDSALAEPILVHELAHAVADQHFNMRQFLDKGPNSDDAQTARVAVVEGQAMWIMVESQLRALGQSLTRNPAYLDTLLPTMGRLAADSYPVFANAPLYLRESLVFPYTSGLQFQQATIARFGQAAFSQVLEHPPVSTAQLIHPEQYFAGVQPTRPALPPPDSPRAYSRLMTGSWGELDLRILFEQYTSEQEARQFAPHWRGSAFDLMQHRRQPTCLLRWAVELDSPASAAEFMRLYRRVLEAKLQSPVFTNADDAHLTGHAGTSSFRIVSEGTVVRGLEGLQLVQTNTRPAI